MKKGLVVVIAVLEFISIVSVHCIFPPFIPISLSDNGQFAIEIVEL